MSMTWTDKGPDDWFKESEIVLRYVDFPQNSEGMYSDELAIYLRSIDKDTVNVKVEVFTQFWCLRGRYGLRQIDGVDLKTVYPGYEYDSAGKSVGYAQRIPGEQTGEEVFEYVWAYNGFGPIRLSDELGNPIDVELIRFPPPRDHWWCSILD